MKATIKRRYDRTGIWGQQGEYKELCLSQYNFMESQGIYVAYYQAAKGT